MLKTVTNGNINFHAQVKARYPPVIKESFIDDDGEITYILANGRTCKETVYQNLWYPVKTPIKAKWETKGPNPDTTKIPH